MSSQTEKLQNITMSSGGVYSLTTRGAEDVINAATPMLLSALDSMNISKKNVFFQNDFFYSTHNKSFYSKFLN